MSSSLRFCMITTFYPPYSFGGDAVFVQQLSHELARRGHEVEVIHCADAYRALAGAEPASSGTESPGVTVHRLRSGLGIISPLATQQTGLPILKARTIRALLGRGFDVVHYHNMSLIGDLGLDRSLAPVTLQTLHEYWWVCPTHMLFKYDREPCTRKRCVPCTLVHRRPPQFWRWLGGLRRSADRVDTFITASRFARDKHAEMGFERPIEVLPYFTTRGAAAAPAPPVTPPAKPYFLFVGRLERVKGLQTLIPLFRRYARARLVVAGTGSYEATLRRMAEGAGEITFLGHQSGDQLGQLYANAVALIVPSVWYEVFGLVIIEAFAHGTPAIVRNIGGMPEIIEDSGGGFVYDTEEELVARMDALQDEPELRRARGQAGYQALRLRWSADVHIERYMTLIQAARGQRSQRTWG